MGAFGPFKSLNPEDVRFSEELRDHGLRVISTVNEILKHRYVTHKYSCTHQGTAQTDTADDTGRIQFKVLITLPIIA